MIPPPSTSPPDDLPVGHGTPSWGGCKLPARGWPRPLRWDIVLLVSVRALLRLGLRCNSGCVFCHCGAAGHAVRELTTMEASRRVAAVAASGAREVVFSGGEPTARDDLVTLCRLARRLGLRPGLVTNGMRLADPTLRRALVDTGLGYVCVSLHGPSAEVHDALAGVSSFERATTAIEALAGEALDLAVTTVVCRPNLDRLEPTVRLVGRLLRAAPERLGWPRHRLALLEPKGRAAGRPDLVPDPAEAARAIGGAISMGREIPGHRIGHDGLPPCLAPREPAGPDDLRAHGILWMMEVHENRLFPTDGGARALGAPCGACVTRPTCPGVYEGYVPGWEGSLVPRRE